VFATGEELAARYGMVAVTMCFLTVGIQAAVHASAGSLRMPLARYLPALTPGALLWAAVYPSVGLAAARLASTRLTWAAAVLVVTVGALLLAQRQPRFRWASAGMARDLPADDGSTFRRLRDLQVPPMAEGALPHVRQPALGDSVR